MGAADILILALIAVCVVLAWRTARKNGGCSCGSGGCCGDCSACRGNRSCTRPEKK